MTHTGATRWLTIAAAMLIAIGILFSWTTTGPLAALNIGFVDLAIFPLDGLQSYAAGETRLLAAIVGALTAAFGVILLQVTRLVYVNDPATGRHIILACVLAWFIIDSIGSVLAGAPFNIVLNLSLLAMLLPPLLLYRPAALSPST